MKKIQIFLLLSLVCLFTVSCEKDNPQTVREVKTYDSFIVKMPSFSSESKAYFNFGADKNILYEDGDVIYVNGKSFTLHRYGNETDGYYWKAEGEESVTADLFDCCYADGSVSNYDKDEHTYSVNFTSNMASTSGIFLADTTSTNVLTFHPRFAILVLESDDYTKIQVGFDAQRVPRSFTISTLDGSFPSITYFNKASSTNPASLMTFKKRNGYFYVAVPIVGDGVNTKLYFKYYTDESTYTMRVTSQAVRLEPGMVYEIPSDDMSDYPFDVNGASKSLFSVSSTDKVRFSAGNLQCKPSDMYSTSDNAKAWIFANHQYDMVPSSNNLNPTVNQQYYMDLFAWATGSWFPPYDASNSPSHYGGLSDLGPDDWGVNSANIFYGNTKTQLTWRTLSISEWQYLLNRTKSGEPLIAYAVIGGNTRGLVILPDDWDPSRTVRGFFTQNAMNTLTIDQWDKVEAEGAIFLPAAGQRYRDSWENVSDQMNSYGYEGWYWSSTHENRNYAKALSFIFPNAPNTPSYNANNNVERQMGLSVRLVTDVANN